MSDPSDSFVIETRHTYIWLGDYLIEVKWTGVAVAAAVLVACALFVTWIVRRKRRPTVPHDPRP